MRVLCCIDETNVAQLQTTISSLLPTANLTIHVLYVIDSGPQKEITQQQTRLLRTRPLSNRQQAQMHSAAQDAAQDILREATRYFPDAEPIQRVGRPEREIVNSAAELKTDLLVLAPHSLRSGRATLGPKSVGHVARFVLDHAPCPVLLARPLIYEQFPLPR